MHIRIHTLTHIHKHTHSKCVAVSARICMHIYICTHIHIYIHAQVMSMAVEIRSEGVPGYAPNTREQFEAWGKIWPLNFRPPQVYMYVCKYASMNVYTYECA
jgi:hypothetical protein